MSIQYAAQFRSKLYWISSVYPNLCLILALLNFCILSMLVLSWEVLDKEGYVRWEVFENASLVLLILSEILLQDPS